jgi:hypothetical protein
MSFVNTITDSADRFRVASPITVPRFTAPFDGTQAYYLLEQDYFIDAKLFAPLRLNTPHPVYKTYLLVKESATTLAGLGCVKWTRTYAQVPATRNDPSTISYQFIGYQGFLSSIFAVITNIPGRKRFAKTVTSRVQYDYFLVDSQTGVLAGPTYDTPQHIPTIQAQAYYMRVGTFTIGSTGSGSASTWTGTYTLGSPQDIAQGLPVDYISDQYGTVGGYQNGVIPTVPTRTQYMALVSAGSEIVAKDSQLTRWMGNIYARATTYIVAQ